MTQKKDCIKNEKIMYLKEILRIFDEFEIGKKYIFAYNSRIRDYEYELHKLNQKMIYMYIFNNKIEITKKDEGKFEVIINLNDYNTIAERRRLMKFLKTDSGHYFHELVYYYHGNWYLVLNDMSSVIRKDNRILKLVIIKKKEKYYLTLPELLRKELPEIEYGYPLKKGILYIHEINNKKVKDLITYNEKKKRNIPEIILLKMKNRKIEYMIFKMLLKKGIFEYFKKEIFTFSTALLFRIPKDEWKDHEWEFTNIVSNKIERMRGGRFPNFLISAVQDYDYDTTNQILIKFITPHRETFLCGVDYNNNMWCMQLPGYMLRYRIKSVYKVMYDLDEDIKLFEF